jgi:hypothetical protein
MTSFATCKMTAVMLAGALTFCAPSYGQSAKDTVKGSTLGFAITHWNFAAYETKFWDECPDGPNIGQDEIWWRGLSKADRSKFTGNGTVDTNIRIQLANHRGPNGEDVCWQPSLFKNDPPIKEPESKISFGMNLDGTDDGRATQTTCEHKKFESSPDGDTHVDNQLYRVLGCTVAWRGFKLLDNYSNQERISTGRGLILVEVTGVTDPQNSNDVQVKFFRAIDQVPRDSAGNILPYGSYRIDTNVDGTVRMGGVARGRIVNGVLMTDPSDVVLPRNGQNGTMSEIPLGAMKLKLKINPEEGSARSKGIIAGYHDLEAWWHEIVNGETGTSHGDYNCPSMYEAMHRLADGKKDPATGKCTAISSAFLIEAIPAFVIHPQREIAQAR